MDSFPMSWQPISSYPSPQKKKKNSGGGPRLSLKESTKVVQSFQASVFRFKDNRKNKFSVWKRKLRPNTRFWDISFFRTSEGWNAALIRCFPIIKLWQLIATNDFTPSMPTADWCQKLVKLSLFVMNAAPFPPCFQSPCSSLPLTLTRVWNLLHTLQRFHEIIWRFMIIWNQTARMTGHRDW